jgi:O-antigen/teichoic acid export membrane protein
MRLLTPSTFGLMGMVTVFTGFAAIFGDFGFASALIQKSDTSEEHFTSIFWLNLSLGLGLTLLFIVIAPLLSTFFGVPALLPLTAVIALNFLIVSPAWVPLALLQKRLAFKQLALIDLTALLLSGITAIGMAVGGFHVWSLVGQAIIFSLTRSFLLWQFAHWHPRGRIQGALVRELMAFSAQTTVFSVCNYCIRNADNFLVAKLLGKEALGLYSRAYSLMLMPLTVVSNKISAILFPAFSSIQTERQRIAAIYLRTVRLIAMLTFPMMTGLFLCADVFVLSVFGSPWKGIIPLLQIFAIVGTIESIGTLNGSLYLSQGQTKLRLHVLAVVGPLAILAIVVGSHWGIRGVAMAYAIYSLLVAIPSMVIPLRLVGLTIIDVGRCLLSVTGCTVAMGVAVWASGHLLPPAFSPLLRLFTLTGTGITCYTALVCIFRIEAGRDMIAILHEQWQTTISNARQSINKENT